MYLGADFVGRMNLDLVAIGEHFTAGFGVDPQLQVTRELLSKTKSLQGGNQVHDLRYQIRIASFKSKEVKMQVWDRLPHGENESLGVTLVKATPELCKDPVYQREERSNNLLRWDLEVAPRMRGEKAMLATQACSAPSPVTAVKRCSTLPVAISHSRTWATASGRSVDSVARVRPSGDSATD